MNNKSVVCVIGVGNIGKHHVNSLMSSGHIVYMIDPINPNIKSAFWHPELNKNILREADIFVISTTSANHYQSLKKNFR